MTLDEIRWLSEMFKTGNMSKAADHLFISQPALSQCLQRVEQQLGFPLFERSNKGMVPTEKGLLFYDMACRVECAYDQFQAKAALLDQAELKSVVIGMAPYLSSKASTDLLIHLKAAYPHIHFSVYESNSADLLDAVLKNKIQIAVTSEAASPNGVSVRFLTQSENVIFLRAGSEARAKAYVKNGKRYLDPRCLKDEPIALTKKGASSRAIADKVFAECGFKPNLLLETSHISTLVRNARAGLSSSISPCTQEAYELDEDGDIIYHIPESYKWSKIRVVTYTLMETDRLIPRDMFEIIRKITIDCGVFYIGK